MKLKEQITKSLEDLLTRRQAEIQATKILKLIDQPPNQSDLLTDEEIIHNVLENNLHTEKEGYLLVAKAIRADERAKIGKWLDRWRFQEENAQTDLIKFIDQLKQGTNPERG